MVTESIIEVCIFRTEGSLDCLKKHDNEEGFYVKKRGECLGWTSYNEVGRRLLGRIWTQKQRNLKGNQKITNSEPLGSPA